MNEIRVYKSMLGWKEENEKKAGTHILLSLDEYRRLHRTIENEKHEKQKAEASASRELNELKKLANEKIQRMMDQRDLANAEKEKYENANVNLKRICKERANAERNLRPKKQHSGYVVMDATMHEAKIFTGRSCNTYTDAWRIRIQTPYPATMDTKSAKTMVLQDDMSKILGMLELGRKIIYGTEEWKNTRYAYDAKMKANYKIGYWELELYTNDPVQPPEDMLPVKKNKKAT